MLSCQNATGLSTHQDPYVDDITPARHECYIREAALQVSACRNTCRYGHIYKMAQAELEGINSVGGVEGILYQVASPIASKVLPVRIT